MKLLFFSLLAIIATAESFKCEPGSSFKRYCNTCSCTDDGNAARCTLIGCNYLLWNEDGSIRPIMNVQPGPGQICKPHSSFMEYCNRCRCSGDGKFKSCTPTECESGVWNKNGTLKIKTVEESMYTDTELICKPYSRFKDYCNTCECSHDGKSKACTFMNCDANLWYKNGTLKVEIKDEYNADPDDYVCEPHSISPSSCNFCKCQADGKDADCSSMLCDPRVWNEDGSMKTETESRNYDYFG